jgi:hypothetical protein
MSQIDFSKFKVELPLKRAFQWRVLFVLVVLYVIGNLAGVPLLIRKNLPIEPVWFWGVATIIAALVISVSLVMANHTAIGAPLLEGRLPNNEGSNWFRSGLALCVLMLAFGFPLGLIVNLGVDQATYPFGFELLGAAFKAGVVEELLYRFFLVSLFVWLGGLFKRDVDGRPAPSVYWSAIILAGLMFGWAHVDARLSNPSMTFTGYFFIMVLTSCLGIFFGWLFVVLGLEWAMFAHFLFDAFLSMVLVPIYLLRSPIAWITLIVGLIAASVISLRFLARVQEGA